MGQLGIVIDPQGMQEIKDRQFREDMLREVGEDES